MDTFEKLRTSKGLTENDRATVAYVLDHVDEVTRISSRELARRTHTNGTAVLRFCRRLGFACYQDFKVHVASDLKRTDPGTTRLAERERALSALAKMAKLETGVIEEMRRTLDLAALQRAAELVLSAAGVDFFAVEYNAILAHHGAHLLSYTGAAVAVHETAEMCLRQASAIADGHVGVVISRGGRSGVACEAASRLASRKVPTIALTADTTSPVAERGECVLVCPYGDKRDMGDVVFHCAVRFALDTFYAMVFSGKYAQNAQSVVDDYNPSIARVMADGGWDTEAMTRLEG